MSYGNVKLNKSRIIHQGLIGSPTSHRFFLRHDECSIVIGKPHPLSLTLKEAIASRVGRDVTCRTQIARITFDMDERTVKESTIVFEMSSEIVVFCFQENN